MACLLAAPMSAVERLEECRILQADGERASAGKIRLAGATREAVRFDVGQAVEMSCPGPAGVLVFSIGAKGLAPGDAVDFHLEAAAEGGRWESLRRAPAAFHAGAGGWADQRIELAARPVDRRLRLQVVVKKAQPGAELFVGGVRYFSSRAAAEQPNIILISLDTLGAQYLGSFGGRADASRNLDRFLARSYSFRRAYATYPNTLVSHASVLSGLYPSSHGVYGSARDTMVSFDLLSAVTRKRGYWNVAFTENAFVSSDFGFDRDFDWYDDGPERAESSFLGDAKQTFSRASHWLEHFGADAPFLLFVHTYEVHSPYIVRDEESRTIADAIHADESIPQSGDLEHLHNAGFAPLSEAQMARMRAIHIGEIGYLDRAFAEFLSRLESLPLARRTLVVLFSDHGDEFDAAGMLGHGETLNDIVLHVPLAFYWPARITPGSFDKPVSLVDVAPTILDLLGTPGALSYDGRSLAALFDGRVDDLEDRPVFAELQRAAATCVGRRLPETCIVGRFVVHTQHARFETSMIPHYKVLTGAADEANLSRFGGFDGLLSRYVTGSPWKPFDRWRPQTVTAESRGAGALDEVTRDRLEKLGYGRR